MPLLPHLIARERGKKEKRREVELPLMRLRNTSRGEKKKRGKVHHIPSTRKGRGGDEIARGITIGAQ